METVTVAEKPKKIHRFQIGLNVVVQIGLLIFLALMVNYRLRALPALGFFARTEIRPLGQNETHA